MASRKLLHPKIPSESNKIKYDQKIYKLCFHSGKLTVTWTTVDVDLLKCELILQVVRSFLRLLIYIQDCEEVRDRWLLLTFRFLTCCS